MTTAAVLFALTYLVIGLQRLPRLHIGRPAGALLGAVGMVACGVLDFDAALRAIDLDTILFLLGMMIVLGYLDLSGFFDLVEERVLALARSGRSLLWLVVGTAGLLSALFMNDTVCLMLTPILVRATRRVGLPAAPYLIALVTAANIGSSCTILGNPQNALIAVRSGIGFLPFVGRLWPIALAGLLVDVWIVGRVYRGSITAHPLPAAPPAGRATVQRSLLAASLVCGAGMVVALILGVRPAAAAMSAAAVVILAGATRPRHALRQVDWSLLLFFGGLFVVMRAVEQAGLAHLVVDGVAGALASGTAAGAASGAGAAVGGPAAAWVLARLGVAVTLLSQAVSNVPAVMLFVPPLEAVPQGAAHPLWLALAAFSTLAGNLTIIGSVANVIVFETARREGVEVGFREYLKVGAPLTLLTCLIAWAWLVAAAWPA